MHFQSAFCRRGKKKKKNAKSGILSKSAVLSIFSVFMGIRIYSDRGDQVIQIKNISPSWQPLASLQVHSWGRLRISLFPEMVLCCPMDAGQGAPVHPRSASMWDYQLWRSPSSLLLPGIFLGYSGSFLALTSSPYTKIPQLEWVI